MYPDVPSFVFDVDEIDHSFYLSFFLFNDSIDDLWMIAVVA